MASRIPIRFRAAPAAHEWARLLAVRLTGETQRTVTVSEVLRTALAVGKSHENEVVRKIRSSA